MPITQDFAPATDTVPDKTFNGTVEVAQAPHLLTLDDGTAELAISLSVSYGTEPAGS